LKQKESRIQNQYYRVGYEYNEKGQLARVVYPSERIVNYSYDTQGRITGVTTQKDSTAVEQTVLNTIQYLPFGPASGWVHGNGLNYSVQYDQGYRLQNTILQDASLKFSRSYDYDLNGNISEVEQNSELYANVHHIYDYDKVDRLTSALFGADAILYSYDAVDNRQNRSFESNNVEIKSESYIYEQDSHHLKSVSTTDSDGTSTSTFSYDDNGNQISNTGKDLSLTYSDANRPLNAAVGASSIAYIHNSLGQRTVKTTTTHSIHYLYGEQGQLLAESYDNGTVIKEYIYLGNQIIAVLVNDNASPEGPVVTIQNASDNVVLDQGSETTLAATAFDTNGDSLSDSILWSSSLGGGLGTGATLTLGNLAIGRHIIMAEVTNSVHQIAYATHSLTIIDPSVP